jgi:hypothetical protein
METLEDRLKKMRSPVEDREYIALTLTANKNGKIEWAVHSSFHGIEEKDGKNPPRELRGPAHIVPEKMANLYDDLRLPYVFVNSESDLMIFLLIGGNAIIDREIAKKRFPEVFKPVEVAPDGIIGYIEVNKVPKDELQRAPTPKNRMKVLKRDEYRCKVCGRKSMDHVDVELNVHHVRPWSMGGLSKGNNLITLCRTCHKGLDPHCDYKLFELMDSTIQIPDGKAMRDELIEGIKRYREISSKAFSKGRKANKRFQQTAKSRGC